MNISPRRVLSNYEKLCKEDISDRDLYQLISDIESLLKFNAAEFAEVFIIDQQNARTMIGSSKLSEAITGVHYFMQLIHSSDYVFGTYILMSWGVDTLEEMVAETPLLDSINSMLKISLDKLNIRKEYD